LPGEVEVAESLEVVAAFPLAFGVTSNRGDDVFWLEEPVEVLVLLSNGCAPGVVVSPGVVEPTPGDVLSPPEGAVAPLLLEPDCPEAGAPDASLPRFKPLD